MDEKEFINVCKESLALADLEITMQTKLQDDLGVTSFDSMNLFSQLEEKYDLRLNWNDFLQVVTIQDLYNIISQNIK